MDDFYLNNKTWDRSSNNLSFYFSDHNNKTYYYNDSLDPFTFGFYVEFLSVILGLVVTLAAIFAVFSLVKKEHAAPVFVINLLISDLIELCSNITGLILGWVPIALYFNYYGIFSSIGFMVCVSMERYLVISKPMLYRFRRNMKTSLMICAVVWVVAFLLTLPLIISTNFYLIVPCVLLLPLPFFIFFLVGTIRALSAAISVPADEKRRIVAILVLMLLVYTLLFLPFILFHLAHTHDIFAYSSNILVSFSPLADSSLYILMRKSAIDKVFASLCCCKISNNQQTSSRHDDTPSALCTETV